MTNEAPLAPVSGMDRPVARRPRRRRTWIVAGVSAAAIAVAAALALLPPPGSLMVRGAELETAAVVRAPFQDYLPVRAEVAPLHVVIVGAVAGGQVKTVMALDGGHVAAGAALVTLANPQLELDVTAREAEIAGRLGDSAGQAMALQKAHVDRDSELALAAYNRLKADHELDIRRQLHAQGFVSDAGLRTYADEAAYDAARVASLKAAQRGQDAIESAQAARLRETDARLRGNLGVVQAGLQALVLRAPVAGRLTDFTLQPGQFLKPGDPVGRIDSEGAYKLVADIDEFYLGRVAPGRRATADIDGADVALTVDRVLPQVAAGRFRAELTFDRPPPAALRRGQTLDLRMTLGDTRPALTVANGAWLEAGSATAFVMDPDGRRARRRAVAVGRRNPEQVEVTAGLRPGERVVTSSYAGFDKATSLIVHP